MRNTDLNTAAAVAFVLVAAPTQAASRTPVSIAPGSLGDALATLGVQTGTSVGLTDPGLASLRVPGLRGRITTEQALARLLRGLPARAERIDASSWRIVHAPPARREAAAPRHATTPPPQAPAGDIVVTASKRDTVLAGYSGTAYLLGGSDLARTRAGGTEAVLARLPTLAATALGSGRNKIFIRGIADSSFNGPSQATVGEYLGDVRLNYSAPDPDLTLVDIASVEVLEGPQGTLYGAATLGGVLRIVPNAPDLRSFGGEIAGGVASTRYGAGSGDVSGVANVPLVDDVVGLRAVGYHATDGGYIDDVGRGQADVNRTVTNGARATLRVEPGDGWTIDLGGAVQTITSDDGQYADRAIGRLSRSSAVAQPFDNDYSLASLSVAKNFGRTTFHTSAGVVSQDLDSLFDFTPPGGPVTVFDENNRIRLLSGEASLARRSRDGVGWILGVSAFHNKERLTRDLGTLPDPPQILGVRNETTNASGFAEAGIRLSPTLVATGGARLDWAHLIGEALAERPSENEEPRRDELSVLPSAALTWRPGTRTTIYARYQEGFRPGGLSVSGTDGTMVQRFRGDDLLVVEIGTRFTDLLGTRFDGGVTSSYTRWQNIQADLIDVNGLPFTANVGDGRILGLEAQLGRRIVRGMRGEVALFVNKSRLIKPAAALMIEGRPALPNVAKAGARAALALDLPLTDTLSLTGDAALRYVGHSRLGVGPTLDILQGDYFDTSASLRIGTRRFGATLDLTNLLDARGNRFSLGNPFDVASGRQVVPLRPRTVRIGVNARF